MPKDDSKVINGLCYSCDHAENIGHSCDWLLCSNCMIDTNEAWDIYVGALKGAKLSARVWLNAKNCQHQCPKHYTQTDKTYVSSDYADKQRRLGVKLPSHCAGCGGKIR